MKRIQTLSHPGRRRWFEYTGDHRNGVVLVHKVKTPVSGALFGAALQRFQGRTVVGGFGMTDPPADGFGAWVAANSKVLTGRVLTPRHGSFIAAILVHETYVQHSLQGNAVVLHF